MTSPYRLMGKYNERNVLSCHPSFVDCLSCVSICLSVFLSSAAASAPPPPPSSLFHLNFKVNFKVRFSYKKVPILRMHVDESWHISTLVATTTTIKMHDVIDLPRKLPHVLFYAILLSLTRGQRRYAFCHYRVDLSFLDFPVT